jgi:glycerate dehydrogenase
MNIVLLEADTLGQDIDLSIFQKFGNFIAYNTTQVDEVPERIQDADILIVNKLPMNQTTLTEATHLKLICVTATGTNNIDFTYTDSRHITVNNAVGYSTASVVQHTFALYFYVAEKLRYYDDYVKSGS